MKQLLADADTLRAQCNAAAGPWPCGAPDREFTRSPAAMRVGHLATEAELFLFHFEHRVHLELPEDWVERPEDAAPPEWLGGVLPERKYQSFRHDLLIGSFHPGHRAKWSAHELCHALVGFAWRPDPSPLFLATAGRLAELLPVVLWYFLDEAYLQRCPVHQGGGALFRKHCLACDAAAQPNLGDVHAERRLEEAVRFMERELAAGTPGGSGPGHTVSHCHRRRYELGIPPAPAGWQEAAGNGLLATPGNPSLHPEAQRMLRC